MADIKDRGLKQGAIGIFDSGYGGLTILSEIRKVLPCLLYTSDAADERINV